MKRFVLMLTLIVTVMFLVATANAQVEGEIEQYMSSDVNQDNKLDLSELLRQIQFYNSGGYHQCTGSEDGFCPSIKPIEYVFVVNLGGEGGFITLSPAQPVTGYEAGTEVTASAVLLPGWTLKHLVVNGKQSSAMSVSFKVLATTTISIVCEIATTEGQLEGSAEGTIEGTTEGVTEGIVEGQPEGTIEGIVEGQIEGSIEGTTEGAVEGQVEGITEGETEGTAEGVIEGIAEVEGSVEGTTEGVTEGIVEGQSEGTIEGSVEGTVEGSTEGEAVTIPTITFSCPDVDNRMKVKIQTPEGTELKDILIGRITGEIVYVGIAGPSENWTWDPITGPTNSDTVLLQNINQLTTGFDDIEWHSGDYVFWGTPFVISSSGQMRFLNLAICKALYGNNPTQNFVIDDNVGKKVIAFYREDGNCS